MDQENLQADRRPSASRAAPGLYRPDERGPDEPEPDKPEPDERGSAGFLALEMLHKIRNPLEVLQYLVYLAHQEAENPQQVKRYMQLAEEHLGTLSRIAGQTLHFAELAGGIVPIDLVDLAECALRIHQQTIESKQIHLVRDLPKKLLAGVYRDQMQQVISSLIVNAIESLHPDGTLSIRLRKRRDGLHLMIVDNGHGIAAEHQSRVFEPFYSTKGKKGAGIGLALARQIVEDHHGKLSMRSSVRPGRSGTAFKVYLAAAEADKLG